jgi:hypothetical protein
LLAHTQTQQARKLLTALFFSLKHLFVISASALSFNSSLRLRRGVFPFPTLQAFFVCANTPTMASLTHIAAVFSDYKYDKDVGFESSDGEPCLGCITEIGRDISCACVATNDPSRCVVCEYYDIRCGSVSLIDEYSVMRLTSSCRSLQSFSAPPKCTGTLWLACKVRNVSSTDAKYGAFVVRLRLAGQHGVSLKYTS